MLKTFIRGLDNVISQIAMLINKSNNSHVYCCMNHKQRIKSTPKYSKLLTNCDAINRVSKWSSLQNRGKIFYKHLSLSLLKCFSVYSTSGYGQDCTTSYFPFRASPALKTVNCACATKYYLFILLFFCKSLRESAIYRIKQHCILVYIHTKQNYVYMYGTCHCSSQRWKVTNYIYSRYCNWVAFLCTCTFLSNVFNL